MDRQLIIERLKRHQADLIELGLAHVSLFGSTARGQSTDASDVDLAVTLDQTKQIDLFRFAAISDKVSALLGSRADLVVEPARSARMQRQIDRDRLHVY